LRKRAVWATMAGMDWEIHGHAWAADMLRRHIANDKLRHAYLFSGPDGVGRRTLALRFAQAVNCENAPEPGVACGECRTCRQIDRMQHADLVVVQGEQAGELKVEQVRELQHFVALAPYASRYRVALLLNFEQANESAQNALLKTLEEPNPNVLLLVTVDDAENLLPTITSRCELMRLRPIPVKALSEKLSEKYSVDTTRADLYAHLAGGRVGYAVSLAQDEELIEQRHGWMADLRQLLSSDKNGRISYSRKHTHKRYVPERSEAKKQLDDALHFWLSFWRDVLLIASGSQTEITNIDMQAAVQETAQSVSAAQAEHVVREIERSFARLWHANLQLMLDNLLLSWPTLSKEI